MLTSLLLSGLLVPEEEDANISVSRGASWALLTMAACPDFATIAAVDTW